MTTELSVGTIATPADHSPAQPGNLLAASAYASRGWAVFPLHTPTDGRCSCGRSDCAHPGKHPRTQHGLHDATTDEATIRRWWTQWPEASIGLVTGALSGLVVLDVDPRHGGGETLAEMVGKHEPLPDTVESCTGGGGRHIFFSHPGGQVKSRSLAPGVDVKADGGYVVAPPSLHASGRRYTWELSSHPDDTALAPLPEWLLSTIKTPPDHSGPLPAGTAAPIPYHRRNVTLASLAGTMRRVGMEEREILAALREVNAGRCQPSLSDKEVAEIVKSVGRYAPASVPGAGDASSLSSSLKADDDDDDRNRAPVELWTLAKPGPRQWVVAGLVPARAATVLYGDGGMAKSLSALLIGDCVARGQNLFGRRVQQGRVLYLDWELDEEEQLRRAYRVAAGLGYASSASGLFYRRMVHPLNTSLPQIKRWVEELQIALVILDSFGLATRGDPTTARDVAPLLASVSRLPCACLFIDHVRNLQAGERSEDLRPFGSVYKFNIARSVIRTTRVGGDDVSLSILLRQTKSNFSRLSEPLGLHVSFEEERVMFEQLPPSSPFLTAANAEFPAHERVHQALLAAGQACPADLAATTGLHVGSVRNLLTRLRKKGKAAPLSRGIWTSAPSSSSSPHLGDDDNDESAGGR